MKVLMAMSGGVDSSVAAAILLKKGYACIGATMRLFDSEDINPPETGTSTDPAQLTSYAVADIDPNRVGADSAKGIDPNRVDADSAKGADPARVGADSAKGADPRRTTIEPGSRVDRASGTTSVRHKTCCSLDDVEDARSVARRLDIPYYVFNLKDEFRVRVMDKFASSYLGGETPNPCIDCNKYLKFGALYRRSKELGCDYIATGHYARINHNLKTGRWELLRGIDPSRDQSYVLYFLTQDELKHTLFPLGTYTKGECRIMALEMDLPNAGKHDSQDICFIPDGDHARFIRGYIGHDFGPGNFVDISGHILGRHQGIACYTIGQRKGLGLSLGHPAYVKEIRPQKNEVVISDDSALYSDTLYAKDFNWISMAPGDPEIDKLDLTAQIRYRHHPDRARIYLIDPHDPSLVKVVFQDPQRAVTKGQAIVVYDGERVVGGGTIV